MHVYTGPVLDDPLPLARRERIAARLAAGQPVAAGALAAEFGVSEDAVRRDLRALAALGRCRRVYGGALPNAAAAPPMRARLMADPDRKRQLATAGAGTVRRGELVFLDCGSTNFALADLLPEDLDLTVATNSVDIAAAILARQDLRLLVVGGLADPLVGGCVDAAAVQCVASMRIDRSFVGTCAVSLEHGLSAFGFADATFKRALVASTERLVALATTDKFDLPAPHHVAALDRLDTLVVEADFDADRIASLKRSGCRSVLRAAAA